MKAVATEKGREYAIQKLRERRANPPEKVDNASLLANSPMYYYCFSCGAVSDILPEDYMCGPSHMCSECAALQKLGWLLE